MLICKFKEMQRCSDLKGYYIEITHILRLDLNHQNAVLRFPVIDQEVHELSSRSLDGYYVLQGTLVIDLYSVVRTVAFSHIRVLLHHKSEVLGFLPVSDTVVSHRVTEEKEGSFRSKDLHPVCDGSKERGFIRVLLHQAPDKYGAKPDICLEIVVGFHAV